MTPHPRRAGLMQLDLEWTARWRWSDLPAGVRDAVREQLRRLLLEAAARARGGDPERRDE